MFNILISSYFFFGLFGQIRLIINQIILEQLSILHSIQLNNAQISTCTQNLLSICLTLCPLLYDPSHLNLYESFHPFVDRIDRYAWCGFELFKTEQSIRCHHAQLTKFDTWGIKKIV